MNATGWDFYFLRGKLGAKYYVAGLDLERCVELPWCANRLAASTAKTVLDLGSRNSVFPLFLASKMGLSVTGIDLDLILDTQKAYVQKLVKSGLDENLIKYLQMDATKMTFEDNSFDAATCISMIEHVPGGGDSDVMRELYRVLKPGGALLLTVPSFPEYREEFHKQTVYDREFQGEEVFFGRIYDEKALQDRLLSAAPFKVKEKVFIGQPEWDFSGFWWIRMPFIAKLPFRWATPVFAARYFKEIASPAQSKGISLACLALEK